MLTPAWTETHAADLGVAITEALAYAADHLSYQQDALRTEAYIDRPAAVSRCAATRAWSTTKLREGCNARTLVAVTTATEGLPIPAATPFYTCAPACRAPPATAIQSPSSWRGRAARLHGDADSVLYLAHNEINFYTWADADCCLPQGATRLPWKSTLRTSRSATR